jgi:hypothetical protein
VKLRKRRRLSEKRGLLLRMHPTNSPRCVSLGRCLNSRRKTGGRTSNTTAIVSTRVKDVVKAEVPEALLKEWGQVARRFLELQGLLAFAEQREMLPDTFRRWQALADCSFADAQNRPLASLRAALAALENDADAALPSL